MFNPDKAVVHYTPSSDDVIVYGQSAWVYPVDHTSPLVSNTKIVRTSPVVAIGHSGQFETLNSVYKPVEYSTHGGN
jgi:hypothetical protein